MSDKEDTATAEVQEQQGSQEEQTAAANQEGQEQQQATIETAQEQQGQAEEQAADTTAPTEQAPAEQKEDAAQEEIEALAAPPTPSAPPQDDTQTPMDQSEAQVNEQAPAQQEEVPQAEEKAEEQEAQMEAPAQEVAQESPPTPVQIQDELAPEPQAVPTAPPMDGLHTRSESAESQHGSGPLSALNLSWSFGMNQRNPVINLTDEHRRMIAYTCAHTGILYDFANNKQYLLQGHSNAISCTCVSADRRWFATADKGDEGLIIVWDTYTGNPVRTMFDPHPDGGVAAMTMTPDAKFLATISAAEKQTLAIWDWSNESDKPLCTAVLSPDYGEQNYIHFNPEDTSQLVTNSDNRCIFYQWGGGRLEYFAPSLTDDDFNKQVGRFSQSIFMANSNKALTATSVGNLVVWDTNKPTKVGGKQKVADKKAIKLVKLQERGISVITTTEDCIVLGDVLGHVKFFDQKLKLMNWYQDFHLGPINSISFAYFPDFNNPFEPIEGDYPPDATISAKQFVLRDFVIGTTNAIYGHVTTDGTDVKIIHRDHDAAVFGLAAHPIQPYVAIGSYSGLIKVWDYERKEVVVSRKFERGNMIRCCTYDPKGAFLAIGFTNGIVRIVDACSLDDLLKTPFRYSRDAITHIAFSHNSAYMAVADAEFTMSLFTRQAEEEGDPFTYIGRYRAHYKLIADIMFGVQLDSNEPRLLSVGEDRHMVEYDLQNSCKDDLRILTSDRIEQSAVPLCMTWYPPVTKESFILTANDQYKFKLYNATTKMCRQTLLGPAFGSPIQKVLVLPTEDEVNDTRFVAYITADKVGIHTLPLDGNPHNAMALIAHPQGVTNVVCSNDGRYLFTAGGIDSTVHMWDINLGALQNQARLGGEGLVPFYGLLDGGRDGELYKELEDYFYYAQLRSQGVDTMDSRSVNTSIPVSEIPFVMRALGFYPSEQEIEDMLNEVKYSTYVATGTYKTHVDLGEFIRLYVNHRPAFGLEPEKLLWAFEKLGDVDDIVDRGELLDLLQNRGEHMTEYELAEYLTTLLGLNDEGGSSELHEFDASQAGTLIDKNMPHRITGEMFANQLLGFGLYSDVLQVDSASSH